MTLEPHSPLPNVVSAPQLEDAISKKAILAQGLPRNCQLKGEDVRDGRLSSSSMGPNSVLSSGAVRQLEQLPAFRTLPKLPFFQLMKLCHPFYRCSH